MAEKKQVETQEKNNGQVPMDSRSARQILAAEQRQRIAGASQIFQDAQNQMREEFNCVLVAVPNITPDGRVIAQLQIVSQD